MHEKPEKLTTVEARQGSRNRLNFRVLVISMTILVAIFLALYFAYFGSVTPAPAP